MLLLRYTGTAEKRVKASDKYAAQGLDQRAWGHERVWHCPVYHRLPATTLVDELTNHRWLRPKALQSAGLATCPAVQLGQFVGRLGPMKPAPKDDVTAALLNLSGQGEHPIVITAEGDRITGTWSRNLSGQPTGDGGITLLGDATWNWHVTLLDEGLYKASMSSRNWPEDGGHFTFRSS